MRLLEVLGFQDVIKILTDEKTRREKKDEELNRKAKVFGTILVNSEN